MRILLLVLTLLISSGSFSQDISHLRISLLTCSPGEELYSTFGHSGLRVTDTTTHTDVVFNYGTFDYYDPGFYSKFVKGKLEYYLEADPFLDFVYAYQMDGRTVVEQELDLTAGEKIRLYHALRENAKPENKYYRYDFLFDNCATRIRDIVKVNSDNLQFPELLPVNTVTFRHLIYEYLDNNKAWWSKLGIDILLGAGMDKYANSDQSMFLPDYLYRGFDSATVNRRALVTKRNAIFTPVLSAAAGSSIFTPSLTFGILLLLFVLLSFLHKTGILKVLDFLLFLSAGLLGILLIVMWTATDHQLCASNYNLLWAIPLHVFAAFTIFSKRTLPAYWKACTIVYALLIVLWAVLPQNMNEALIPLVILLGWRSWVQGRKK